MNDEILRTHVHLLIRPKENWFPVSVFFPQSNRSHCSLMPIYGFSRIQFETESISVHKRILFISMSRCQTKKPAHVSVS